MIFLYFLWGFAAAQQEPCGEPVTIFPPDSTYIVGGTDTQPGAFPWQLALETLEGLVNPSWDIKCGAVLIHSEWALTAAHCVDGFSDPMRLVAGLWDKNNRDDTQTIDILPGDITINPDFDGTAENLPNDIAIIHLQTPANTAHLNIQPICLPPTSDFSFVHNPNCFITGWGFTENGGLIPVPPTRPSTILQYAWTDMLGMLNCAGLWDTVNTTMILDTHQCVKDQVNWLLNGDTACGVDMGGPAQCTYDAHFLLAGVGSFTDSICASTMPQVYTNVPSYLDWIKSVTGLEPGPGFVKYSAGRAARYA